MLNIIRGDLYRLRKSRSFAYCLLGIVIVTLLSYVLVEWTMAVADGRTSGGVGGINISVNEPDIFSDMGSAEIMSEVASSKYAFIFFAIFVCVWITSEFGCGAIKNIVGKGCSKIKVFLAKYIAVIGIVFVLNVFTYVAVILFGLIFNGTVNISKAFINDFFTYAILQTLLMIAYAGIVIAVSEMVRSTAVGIAVTMLIFIFSTKLMEVFDLLLNIFGIDAKVSEYWIMSVVYDCYIGTIGTDFAIKSIVISVFWTVLSLAIGILHFSRTDIA